jgi:hypothetical protein
MTVWLPRISDTLIANSTTGTSTVLLLGVENVIVVCAAVKSGVAAKRLTFVF